jgi:hypothetical protein
MGWLTQFCKYLGMIVGGTVMAILVLVSTLGIFMWLMLPRPINQTYWGLTYSAPYARQLGLDSRRAYSDILDQLRPSRVRLVAYWNDIEPRVGQYNFDELDFQVAQAQRRHIPYSIVIGRREPRWPECFEPDWSRTLPIADQQQALYRFEHEVVQRYDASQLLLVWQVENEANVTTFGQCPKFNSAYLPTEVSQVRRWTNKPLLIVGGGETLYQGFHISQFGDYYGTSLYATTTVGQSFLQKPIPPGFYALRGAIVRLIHPQVRQVWITELQAEPWVLGNITQHDQRYFDMTMSHQQFDYMVVRAQKTRLPSVYFWGAEWWYYQKIHGDNYYWQQASRVFKQSRR